MKFLMILALGTTLLFGAVDINTADLKELMTLKGVGESKAKRIIKYRKKRCFKTVEELKKVNCIKGKKVIKKNKGNLTASQCSKK
ncbi:MAG: helix-hairpin-helix domain-containing protein [Campylobacterota bacterium]|nr:helix-hairpin-helix domain-containing protein [Campylobacterota bacterium]